MQNTHTICEISYGPRKEAVIHFTKQSKPSRTLTGSKFDRIKEYIEMPVEDEPLYEKIEIKIPNPLLKVQINIIYLLQNLVNCLVKQVARSWKRNGSVSLRRNTK